MHKIWYGLISLFGFLVVSSVISVPASAYTIQHDADHNGSDMTIINNDGDITIEYARPKSSMQRQGVRSGTVLFDGVIRGQTVEGHARVFRAGCEPVRYWVSGRWRARAERLVLRGDAPKRGPGGCDVIGYQSSGSNARLVFIITGGSGSPDHGDESAGAGGRCGHYIILTCHGNRSAAVRSLNDLGGPGVGGWAGAKVIRTNDFPNFRKGYYCVVDGPYSSHDEAGTIAWKEAVPSAYIKKGC